MSSFKEMREREREEEEEEEEEKKKMRIYAKVERPQQHSAAFECLNGLSLSFSFISSSALNPFPVQRKQSQGLMTTKVYC
jgi:hypothetical protein